MANSVIRDVALPLRLPLPVAVAGGVYLLLLLLGARLLNDPDTYWQIALGQWIGENGALPRADMFSFTMAGAPWISSQWLAQVLFAEVHAAAGWAGVVALAAAAVAAACALLTHFLQERLAPIPTLVFVTAALAISAPHLVARPHALALPVMVAWIGGLVRAVDQRRAPSFALLPLMALWANLHGGFTLGLALAAAIALDALWSAPHAERRALALRWGLFSLAAGLAACATPYGPESILVTLRILGLGDALAIIGEWQSQNFSRLAAFEVCLLLAIGFVLARGLTLPPVRIFIVLGLLHLALSANRNGEVLALLAPLFIAQPLAAQISGCRKEAGESPTGAKANALAAAFMAMILVFGTWTAAALLRLAPDPRVTPERAVQALRDANAARVLNDYDFGGYLIAAGVAPFIDGRTELYGGAFTLRHHHAVMLRDLDDFLRLLDEHRIDATLLNPQTPAVRLLDRLPGWKRIHSDAIAVVHQRTGASAARLVSGSPDR